MKFENKPRKCKQCGKTFYAIEDWKKICVGCYIESKNKEKQYNQQYNQYQQQNYTFTPKKEEIKQLDTDTIKKLLYLCHPDKHNNSLTSNEMTKFLLKKRDEL